MFTQKTSPKDSVREQKLIVTFSDGTKYSIPAWVIAHNKATYYANKENKDAQTVVYFTEFTSAMESESELIDWAKGNMDWKDVSSLATQIPREENPTMSGDEWCNSLMVIVPN